MSPTRDSRKAMLREQRLRVRAGVASTHSRPREAAVHAAWIILAFVALRSISSVEMGLGVDESYSLAISRDFRLSYFDHPPLHQWITHSAEAAFGLSRLVRLPFILLFGGSSWLMFRLTQRLYGSRAALWAVVALNLAGFFTFAAGAWILPDGPLIFALLATSAQLSCLFFPRQDEILSPWRLWLAAGLWLGLAGLSKYQAGLFAVGLVLLLVTTRRGRIMLRHPAPYVAGLLTIVILIPVLTWNAEHGWASMRFQAGRAAIAHDLRPGAGFLAIAGQAAILLPWVFLPLAAAGISAARRGSDHARSWFCVLLAGPSIIVFTVAPVFGAPSLPHWSMAGWLMLFPAMGAALAAANRNRRWPRWWAGSSLIALLVLWAIASSDASGGWLPLAFPAMFKKDPTLEMLDWSPLRAEIAPHRRLPGKDGFVVSLKWMEAGKIEVALDGQLPVLLFSDDARQYRYRRQSIEFIGHDALIIGSTETVDQHIKDVRPYFQSLGPPQFISIQRGKRPELQLETIVAHNLLRPYKPSSDVVGGVALAKGPGTLEARPVSHGGISRFVDEPCPIPSRTPAC